MRQVGVVGTCVRQVMMTVMVVASVSEYCLYEVDRIGWKSCFREGPVGWKKEEEIVEHQGKGGGEICKCSWQRSRSRRDLPLPPPS